MDKLNKIVTFATNVDFTDHFEIGMGPSDIMELGTDRFGKLKQVFFFPTVDAADQFRMLASTMLDSAVEVYGAR
jgi:hypothetical protein